MNAELSTRQLQTVDNILIEQLSLQPAQITPDAHFGKDLGADSLDIVELGMRLEEEFELEIADADVDIGSTVGQLYVALAERLAARRV